MSQNISGFNTNSDTMLYVPCPTCGIRAEINLPRFIVAINRKDKFTCGDCGCEFVIKVECLIRDAEQRRVPDPAEQKCPTCKGFRHVAGEGVVSMCLDCKGTGISKRSAGG